MIEDSANNRKKESKVIGLNAVMEKKGHSSEFSTMDKHIGHHILINYLS